jgi:cell fate regulator YaaT (PSP1 superfamily)
MIDVIGVSFEDNSKIYYFSSNNLDLYKGLIVIVETERGMQFGKAVTDITKIDTSMIVNLLKPVIRIASKYDEKKHLDNIKLAKDAVVKA